MRLLLIIGLCFLAPAVLAQKESDKLKQRQRDLQRKISYTKELLGSTKSEERITMAELGIINQQIAHRDELIQIYNHQLSSLETRIADNKEMVVALGNDIVELKRKYALMVYFAYKHRNTQKSALGMWISGEDVNKAYLRMKYLNQIAQYRKLQLTFIKKTQEDLVKEQAELGRNLQEKQDVLVKQDTERQAYQKDKNLQKDVLVNLKQEEDRLKQQLDKQQNKRRKLLAAIKRAIEKEITAQASKKNPSGFGSTPEAIASGKSFAANKGRLPWPVGKGEITGKFGKQPHPVIRGVYTQNNGVDISTNKNASVRAVFKGMVTSIFVIPGAGKAVMISHGNFRSVYANLKEVYVSKGESVAAKQDIGSLLLNDSGGLSEVHFEIWDVRSSQMKQLNPAYWLAK